MKLPTKTFYAFIKSLEVIFYQLFTKQVYLPHVKEEIVKYYEMKFGQNISAELCSTKRVRDILDLYVRCKIFFAVRMHNRRTGRKLGLTKTAVKRIKEQTAVEIDDC